MFNTKLIINSTWFFPALVLYYGLIYLSFGEKFPLYDGLGTDGYVYASFVYDFNKSTFFDLYYVHRFLPSFIIRSIFNLFSVTFNNSNIFLAFQLLNLLSISASCYFLKKLFIHFNISSKKQLLGFLLFLVNFAQLKYPFYLPVMTDSLALLLSSSLLYFYVKKKTVAVGFITILAAFTWQTTFYQGLIFLLLPYAPIAVDEPDKKWKAIFFALSGLLVFTLCLYFIFVLQFDTTLPLVARINRPFLYVSLLGMTLLYSFFSKIFLNRNLISFLQVREQIRLKNTIYATIVFVASQCICIALKPLNQALYPISYVLSNSFVHGLMWPLHNLVSHFSFFGMAIVLLVLFWNSTAKVISGMGLGVVAAITFNLYLFASTPETRQLINLLPWLILFLLIAIDSFSFSNYFYVLTTLLSFAISKIWLSINYETNRDLGMILDKNGSLDFPNQRFFLNLGPWMSEQMYLWQGMCFLLFALLVASSLYKIKRSAKYKWVLTRKF